jgi:hypothetical protein
MSDSDLLFYLFRQIETIKHRGQKQMRRLLPPGVARYFLIDAYPSAEEI